MMRVGKRGLNLAANAAVTAATKVMNAFGNIQDFSSSLSLCTSS